MPDTGYFHLHLVSDATGETLITVARAAAAQYASVVAGRASLPDGALEEAARPCAGRNRRIARPGALHAARGRPDPGAGKQMPRARAALHVGARPGAAAVPVLSRRRDHSPRRRPARAQRGIFPAHRRAQLHHVSRRRPACRRAAGSRRGAGRRLAHLEDADLDLSRQSRRQDRQCAAGAGRAAGARGGEADAAAGGRALCQSRAHRADPREPAAGPESASRRRPLYRQGGGGRGGGVFSPALRHA